MTRSAFAGAVLLCAMACAQAQTVPVTVDNFARAESDLYFGNALKGGATIGSWFHHREPVPVDNQIVIRINRDTLYSSLVVDLDAGPVTIVLPDAGTRFRSLQMINEDHYVIGDVQYRPGSYTLDRNAARTRYAIMAIRTLVDPNDPEDVRQVHALQDATSVSQANTGTFAVPNWDPDSQKAIRQALVVLGRYTGGFRNAFGQQGKVDPVRHLIGSAAAWGGNPDKDATYLSFEPARNDGATVYRLKVKDVPVDGFWSITVYNADGYLQKNDLKRLLAPTTSRPGRAPTRAVAVQFGGCDGEGRELHPDRERLELHRAALSPARRNSRRELEIPRGAGGELSARQPSNSFSSLRSGDARSARSSA